jgi:hypothetical protein
MDQTFANLISCVLTDVQVLACPDLPDAVTAVVLSFNGRDLAILVDANDDTLICAGRDSVDLENYIHRIPAQIWIRAKGKMLTAAWKMINDRGYEDGVQMEFRDPGGHASVVVQMVAAASQVSVFEVFTANAEI